METGITSLGIAASAAGALFPIAVGLGSSFTHCAGMCGPIHIFLSANGRGRHIWMYHAGRILGYGILGGTVGLLGQAVAGLSSPAFRIAAGTALALAYALFGFGLLGFRPSAFDLEKRLGSLFPSRWLGSLAASGAGRKALFPAGLAASLLPCPSTHAVLLWGMGLDHAWQSAGGMVLLGIATLPVFVALPLGTKAIPGWIRIRYRNALGAAFLGLSAWRVFTLITAGAAAACH
ncbi:MAG: hypothetical protein JWP91_2595 [Fibrobacteres bacterium]|nr:hypothetical protein [Fibrobacterota bacterium]